MNPTHRALTSTGLLLLAAACSGQRQAFQGYAEGEFVYLSSPQPGRLDRLGVVRGQQVAAGAPLFALESTQEQAAQRQAQHQLAALQAQMEDIKTGKRPAELAVTSAQLTMFYFLPNVLLSGFLFPFQGMPVWAQDIGQVLPLTHFNRLIRGILLKGNGWTDLWPSIWPLLIFTAVVMAVAVRFYRRTMD